MVVLKPDEAGFQQLRETQRLGKRALHADLPRYEDTFLTRLDGRHTYVLEINHPIRLDGANKSHIRYGQGR